MYCPNCGKEVNDEFLHCPDCGTRMQPPARQAPPPHNYAPEGAEYTPGYAPYRPNPTPTSAEPAENFANASRICGILSVALLFCVPIALPIVAIVMGIVAKSRGNRSHKATVGIVLGCIGLFLALAVGILSLLLYMRDVSSAVINDFGYGYYF